MKYLATTTTWLTMLTMATLVLPATLDAAEPGGLEGPQPPPVDPPSAEEYEDGIARGVQFLLDD